MTETGEPRSRSQIRRIAVEEEARPPAFLDEHDLSVIGAYQECPESKMDDGSHATDYEDSGSCPWCGEQNPDFETATHPSLATPRPPKHLRRAGASHRSPT